MNVIVTGATGFLGSRITESLAQLASVRKIIATGRSLKDSHQVVHPRVVYRLGDLTDTEFLPTLFQEEIDVVINCASLSSPWGSYQQFYQANVLSQQRLIALATQKRVGRFIYISSPSIYFNYRDRFLVKESDPLPNTLVNAYAQTKMKAERLLEQSDLNYLTIRPRAIIGRGDTVIMPRLIRSQQEGRLKIVGSGNNVVDLSSVANVVHAVKLAIEAPLESCRLAYNITNGEPVSLWKMINYVLKSIDLTPPNSKLPFGIAHSLAYILEKKALMFKDQQEPVLTRYSVGTLAKSFTLDISLAKEKLGYQPVQTTQEGIEEFIIWYKTIQNGKS